MKQNRSGFTLVDVLLAMIIGFFLIGLLSVFAIKLGKLQKTVSAQKNLQRTGEYILNDIAKEVSGAHRANASSNSDELVLVYAPLVTASGTITYRRAEYNKEGDVYYVVKTKPKLTDSTATDTDYCLGDPQQIVNIENIKFSYHDSDGTVTNDFVAVKIIKTTISLTSRYPDETKQRIRLSGIAVLNSTRYGKTHGNADYPRPTLINAKTTITIKRQASLFASITLGKNSNGNFTFSLPESTSKSDTYSITALAQITDPFTDNVYIAVPHLLPLQSNDYGSFLSAVDTDTKRSFQLDLDQTKFIAIGEIIISDTTLAYDDYYTDIVTHKGPAILLTVIAGTANEPNNYPNNDFNLWGRLKNVNLTNGGDTVSRTMRIIKISDGTEVDSKTVSTLTDGSATFIFNLPLLLYENPADDFAKIAAFRYSGGMWEPPILVTSKKVSGKFVYSFPKSAGGAGLDKSSTANTTYKFMFVRENAAIPTNISAPPILYQIQVDTSTIGSRVNTIGLEPGQAKDFPYIYAPAP